MQALLSFDKAPPFSAPLRFFLTAPLFAVLAGVVLGFLGEQVLMSRWAPGALAVTHLVTIGFMMQVMAGALIQILPVVAGAHLARPLAVARGVHAGLGLGTLALAGGFLTGKPILFNVAALLLGLAAGGFLIAAGRAVFPVPSTSPTVVGLKLAIAGLACVAGLGIVLALALSRGWGLPLPLLADLHAGWGLGAWSGVLLASMAYVVVPMFQLTPGYPARASWLMPPLMFGALLAWALLAWFGSPLGMRLAEVVAAATGILFAAYSLALQRRRRRARSDALHQAWQGGLACLLAGLAMVPAALLWPEAAEWAGWAPLFGILVGIGGFMAFIVGMLYKIVPFLAWLHLQNLVQGRVPAPPMTRFLAEPRMRAQVRLHFAATALLAAAAVLPELLARPAGVLFAVSNAWLFLNLLAAVRIYREQRTGIEARFAT